MDAEQLVKELLKGPVDETHLTRALILAIQAVGDYADDENWITPHGIPGGYAIQRKDPTNDGSDTAGIALQEIEDALDL